MGGGPYNTSVVYWSEFPAFFFPAIALEMFVKRPLVRTFAVASVSKLFTRLADFREGKKDLLLCRY